MWKYSVVLLLLLWMAPPIHAGASQAEYESAQIEAEGFQNPERLKDGNRSTYCNAKKEGMVTVSYSEGISSLYIEFDRLPSTWTLTDSQSGVTVTCGEYGFLHEFVDVAALFGYLPGKLVMTFGEDTTVADIYAFSQGELPEWVQIWQPPCKEADLMLVSSHSDHEQLFFSGLLPLYAGERGLKVQVVYLVQHFEANQVKNHQRPHEQLDGLWTVGVKNYPVMSDFPDLYSESKNRQKALAQAKTVYDSAGVTYQDFVDYLTECIRSCKPLVVVSHDVNGEYGHGTHVLCADALIQAVACAGDENYGLNEQDTGDAWQVEKLYLHLYEENPIVMNYDVPLAHFDGKTAFEVSREGFDCHKSQHWTWFYKWIYGTDSRPVTKATDIKSYSPCLFGLYDSKVGPDTECNDFLENVTTYEQRALAAEREKLLAQQEEERLRLEREQTQKEQAQKEQARKEQAQREEAEKGKAEMEQAQAKSHADSGDKGGYAICLVALAIGIPVFGLITYKRRRR